MEKLNSSRQHPIVIDRRISRMSTTTASQFNSLFPADYVSDDNTVELGNCLKSKVGYHHHPRANSNTFIEEQTLPWLDELLKEHDSPVICRSQHHQRSISDSFPYFDNIEQKKSSYEFRAACKYHIWHDHHHDFILEADFLMNRTSLKQHSHVSDATKQEMAHRAHARKLQYISEWERNVQILQAEKAQMSAQLHYLHQQFLILGTENRGPKQRLDTLNQEHLLKNFEQNMLERIRKASVCIQPKATPGKSAWLV